MWQIVAAPVLGPSLGVVRDDVVGAARQSEVVAAPDDGGLTGFAASDVGVGGAASAARGSGSPVAPAVAAGVPEGGEGVGGSGEGLLVAFEKSSCVVRVRRELGIEGPERRRRCNVSAKVRRGCRNRRRRRERRCTYLWRRVARADWGARVGRKRRIGVRGGGERRRLRRGPRARGRREGAGRRTRRGSSGAAGRGRRTAFGRRTVLCLLWLRARRRP